MTHLICACLTLRLGVGSSASDGYLSAWIAAAGDAAEYPSSDCMAVYELASVTVQPPTGLRRQRYVVQWSAAVSRSVRSARM